MLAYGLRAERACTHGGWAARRTRAHEALHRPLRDRGRSDAQPAVHQPAARDHAPPPRPRLLAGLERAAEPAHGRPHRLAPARLQGWDHHGGDLPRPGDGRGDRRRPLLRLPDFTSEDFPMHRVILGAGVVIMEGLTNLGALPRRRVEFAAPFYKIAGTEGAPARFLAIV